MKNTVNTNAFERFLACRITARENKQLIPESAMYDQKIITNFPNTNRYLTTAEIIAINAISGDSECKKWAHDYIETMIKKGQGLKLIIAVCLRESTYSAESLKMASENFFKLYQNQLSPETMSIFIKISLGNEVSWQEIIDTVIPPDFVWQVRPSLNQSDYLESCTRLMPAPIKENMPKIIAEFLTKPNSDMVYLKRKIIEELVYLGDQYVQDLVCSNNFQEYAIALAEVLSCDKTYLRFLKRDGHDSGKYLDDDLRINKVWQKVTILFANHLINLNAETRAKAVLIFTQDRRETNYKSDDRPNNYLRFRWDVVEQMITASPDCENFAWFLLSGYFSKDSTLTVEQLTANLQPLQIIRLFKEYATQEDDAQKRNLEKIFIATGLNQLDIFKTELCETVASGLANAGSVNIYIKVLGIKNALTDVTEWLTNHDFYKTDRYDSLSEFILTTLVPNKLSAKNMLLRQIGKLLDNCYELQPEDIDTEDKLRELLRTCNEFGLNDNLKKTVNRIWKTESWRKVLLEHSPDLAFAIKSFVETLDWGTSGSEVEKMIGSFCDNSLVLQKEICQLAWRSNGGALRQFLTLGNRQNWPTDLDAAQKFCLANGNWKSMAGDEANVLKQFLSEEQILDKIFTINLTKYDDCYETICDPQQWIFLFSDKNRLNRLEGWLLLNQNNQLRHYFLEWVKVYQLQHSPKIKKVIKTFLNDGNKWQVEKALELLTT